MNTTLARLTSAIPAEEFIEEVSDSSTRIALRMTAATLRDAAIQLNNDGLRLPEADWTALRNQCDALTQLSEAYERRSRRRAAVSGPVNTTP